RSPRSARPPTTTCSPSPASGRPWSRLSASASPRTSRAPPSTWPRARSPSDPSTPDTRRSTHLEHDLAGGVSILDGGECVGCLLERVQGGDVRIDQVVLDDAGDLLQRLHGAHELGATKLFGGWAVGGRDDGRRVLRQWSELPQRVAADEIEDQIDAARRRPARPVDDARPGGDEGRAGLLDDLALRLRGDADDGELVDATD